MLFQKLVRDDVKRSPPSVGGGVRQMSTWSWGPNLLYNILLFRAHPILCEVCSEYIAMGRDALEGSLIVLEGTAAAANRRPAPLFCRSIDVR